MATKPTKPSHVNVKALREIVDDLTTLQAKVSAPPPNSFSDLGAEIKSNLGTQVDSGSNGLTDISGIDDIDKRYRGAVTTVNQAWPNVTSGITALIGMLNDTIRHHSTADGNATGNANRTNTGQGTGGMGTH